MRARVFLITLGLVSMFMLLACAPGTDRWSPEQKAGFFSGIWHGWIAPVTLIWQLFDPQVRIYEVDNTGWTYDLGFYIAVIAGFGSIALTRRKKR